MTDFLAALAGFLVVFILGLALIIWLDRRFW